MSLLERQTHAIHIEYDNSREEVRLYSVGPVFCVEVVTVGSIVNVQDFYDNREEAEYWYWDLITIRAERRKKAMEKQPT